MVSDRNMANHLWGGGCHDQAFHENTRTLRANWEVVEVRQKDAEKKLLDRITELSEDVQSLRDGVGQPTLVT